MPQGTSFRRAALAASLILLYSGCSAGGADSKPDQTTCTPHLEIINEETLIAEPGVWRIHFDVALVGCQSSIESISSRQRKALREEYLDPSAWSILMLQQRAATKDFRKTATRRTNEILGGNLVTDVLFFNVTIYDYAPGH